MKRLLKLAVLALAACSVGAVLAAMLTYTQVPSSVKIVAPPTLEVYNMDWTPCTQIDWGNVQKGTIKEYTVILKNGKGDKTMYLIPDKSLVAYDLPSNTQVGWGLTNSISLPPGEWVAVKLQLIVSESAPEGEFTFTIEFRAFDSFNG